MDKSLYQGFRVGKHIETGALTTRQAKLNLLEYILDYVWTGEEVELSSYSDEQAVASRDECGCLKCRRRNVRLNSLGDGSI